MKILALEPYYGGSHQAFMDGWSERSRHQWTVLTLPPAKWKWRMRHAAITFADLVNSRLVAGETWDLLFCSDMLNLAEFLGLVGGRMRRVPSVVYFHENQLTYPVRQEKERDFHLPLTNLTTCLAATQVWFNSEFHRRSFLDALPTFLRRLPDYRPLEAPRRIAGKSHVFPPGIADFPPRCPRKDGPLSILWAARWEFDKNPEEFFAALELLKKQGFEFRLSVVGERFKDVPPVFDRAKEQFAEKIQHWGYLPRDEYIAALNKADVIVSTASHEFFGISVVEAIAAGAYPVLPRWLSYPEIIGGDTAMDVDEFFYDGSVKDLARRLALLAGRLEDGNLWRDRPDRLVRSVGRFSWKNLVGKMDETLDEVSATL